MSQPSKTLILWAHLRLACGSQQLCSARKTPAAFCLSLPARNERGESRREGKLIKNASSPRPSPPSLRRRGRENAVLRSKQIFCRTQLVFNLPTAACEQHCADCKSAIRQIENLRGRCRNGASGVHCMRVFESGNTAAKTRPSFP